ncbi:MAG: GIN domain-containing protein [Phocaeicola sp.]
MVKNKFLLTAALLGGLLSTTLYANSNTSSNGITKLVTVESFHGISASSAVDVVYTQSSGAQEIEIYTTPKLMDDVEVVVEDGVLKVGLKRKLTGLSFFVKHEDDPLEVRITAPAVNKLDASSSGDLKLVNGLNVSGKLSISASSAGDIKGGDIVCDELVVMSSSSGDVELERVTSPSVFVLGSSSGDIELKRLKATNVIAKSESSSDVELSGLCESATFKSSSSGDLDAKGLKALNVNASANSSGDISCYATGTLTADTSSGGEIKYRGNPLKIEAERKTKLFLID